MTWVSTTATIACSARVRRLTRLGTGLVVGLVVFGSVAAAGAVASTQTFTVAGDSTFIVPAGVKKLSVKAIGAAGGPCWAAAGGRGASVSGIVPVSPGDTLFVGVAGGGGGGDDGKCPINTPGAGGMGGGAPGGLGKGLNQAVHGAGGGGASAVGQSNGLGGPEFAGLLIVAGGGGGAAYGEIGGDAGSPASPEHRSPAEPAARKGQPTPRQGLLGRP